jgi:hypothetical protein
VDSNHRPPGPELGFQRSTACSDVYFQQVSRGLTNRNLHAVHGSKSKDTMHFDLLDHGDAAPDGDGRRWLRKLFSMSGALWELEAPSRPAKKKKRSKVKQAS